MWSLLYQWCQENTVWEIWYKKSEFSCDKMKITKKFLWPQQPLPPLSNPKPLWWSQQPFLVKLAKKNSAVNYPQSNNLEMSLKIIGQSRKTCHQTHILIPWKPNWPKWIQNGENGRKKTEKISSRISFQSQQLTFS